MSATIEADLRVRWLPSDEQMALADALLAAGYDADRRIDQAGGGSWTESGVYTVHLLLNKEYGWWTEDVEIVHLDGVFLTRSAALDFVHEAAQKHHEKTGDKVVGGYAWHSKVGHAAVWDDISSEFPVPDYKQKKG